MEMTQEVWDRIAALEEQVAIQKKELTTLECSQATLYAKATDSQPAAPAAQAAPLASGGYGHPSLMRLLHRHGIRLQPEDMDDFDGSGSEKYNAATDWTRDPNEGRTYPGLPTQVQADAAVAQGM